MLHSVYILACKKKGEIEQNRRLKGNIITKREGNKYFRNRSCVRVFVCAGKGRVLWAFAGIYC